VEVAAILATLAPRSRRQDVVTAQVALEVLYDYLDTLSEQPAEDQLANGLTLHSALVDAVGSGPGSDYYRYHSERDDGGYLADLVETCAGRFASLPASGVVAPYVRHTAARCGTAQARTHATSTQGVEQLAEWAGDHAGAELLWWEAAAGMAASVVGMHALIAAAARPRTATESAAALARLYLPICSLTTLLDSYDDYERDRADGSHSFVGYYRDLAEALHRIAAVADHASALACSMEEDRHHHVVMVAGVAGFYLSGFPDEAARTIAAQLPASIRPIVSAVLALFRVWRVLH
jgi:tetraprenyl-beta-curcumene synthase